MDNGIPESILLQRVAEGNEKAFQELVTRYAPTLYSYMLRITADKNIAEEWVQDAFIKIWLVRDSLLEVHNFRAYLLIISRNQAINAVKRIIRQKQEFKEWQTYAIQPAHPETDDEWKHTLIDEAIAALPPQQQSVWIMSRKKRMKPGEIAKKMGLTKSTVKKYLQLAIIAIVRYIKERIAFSFF